LISVANRFVSDVDTLKPEIKDSVAKFMAFVHKSVNDMSVTYLQVRIVVLFVFVIRCERLE